MNDESNAEIEHEAEQTILSRRAALRSGAALAGATAIGGVALWYGSQPALAGEVSGWSSTDNPAPIQTHDGTIDDVSINPTASVEWWGFNAGEEITATINARIEPEGETALENNGIVSESFNVGESTSDNSAAQTLDFGGIEESIIGGDIVTAEFATEDTAGAESTTDVVVELEIESTNGGVETATATDIVTITVQNAEGDVTVSGDFDTTVEGDEYDTTTPE